MTNEKWERALALADKRGDEKTASLFRRFARLQANGDVLIIDLPLGAHESAARNFGRLVTRAEDARGVPVGQSLSARGSMSKILPRRFYELMNNSLSLIACSVGNVSQEADESFTPLDKPNPGPGNAGAANAQVATILPIAVL